MTTHSLTIRIANVNKRLESLTERLRKLLGENIVSPQRIEGSTELTFATILDEFTHNCLSHEVRLLPLTKERWREEISGSHVDALMIESAWAGNNGNWRYLISNAAKQNNPLTELVAECQVRGIPTIFWNKEDPVHFEKFLPAAKLFDYIFTTDEGCIDRYKEATNNAKIFVLPFAAQPAIHNPIRRGPRSDRFAFAGSWRGVKYPERGRKLEMLLAPAMKRDKLDIYDRQSGAKLDADFTFPDKFSSALKGALPYNELVDTAYRAYTAFINVNSVENSDTMLARRVYELLACGTPVISSYSRAVERVFGEVVPTPSSECETAAVMDRLSSDLIYRPTLAAKGVRLVHSQHTYRDRINLIANAVGLPALSKGRRKVSVICSSKRPDFLNHIAQQISRQSYEDIEIIFVAHSDAYDEGEIRKAFGKKRDLIVLKGAPENVLADNLNAAIAVSSGDTFAKIDDDDFYGPLYLEDSVRCFEYAPNIGVVGKHTFFAYIESSNKTVCRFPDKYYRLTNHVAGGTLVFDRKATEDILFQKVRRGTDSLFLKDCVNRQVPIFSSDPFNYLHVRYSGPNQHTWDIADGEFEAKTSYVGDSRLDEVVFI